MAVTKQGVSEYQERTHKLTPGAYPLWSPLFSLYPDVQLSVGQ